MDNQLQGPAGGNLESGTGALDPNEAGSLFASIFTDAAEKQEDKKPAATAAKTPPKGVEEGADSQPSSEEEALERAAAEQAKEEGEGEESKDDEDAEKIFTVKIDGKEVRLTAEELVNGYKAQKVSTQKFEQAAEMRKKAEAIHAQAEAEAQAARQDRATYAQNLQSMASQLQSLLQDQGQIDWDRLAVENQPEYVRQRHLLEKRQAAMRQVQGEQVRVSQQHQAEQARFAQQQQQAAAKAQEEYMTEQREKLIAKLPDWKNSDKAKAESSAIAKYLEGEGYTADEISKASDHRAIILARKAMMFDKVMAKAKVATAKVEKLPAKAERPGTVVPPTDGRSAAMQRLQKSGSVEDAGEIFAQMYK